MTRPLGKMNFELFKSLINQCKDTTPFIWISGMLEPLLYDDLFCAIDYCHKNNVRVAIPTNATALTEEKSKRLLELGLDHIIFSFDGADKETYEKIRKNANFDTTIKNIKKFLELKQCGDYKKPYTILQLIVMNLNSNKVDDFMKQWQGHPGIDEIDIKPVNSWGSQVNDAKVGTPVYGSQDKRPPCYLLWHSVLVLQDGTITPCCRDFDGKLALGNVNHESLKSIWNGKKMRELRRMHIDQKFPNGHLCKSCFEYPLAYPSKFLINRENLKLFIKRARGHFTGKGI